MWDVVFSAVCGGIIAVLLVAWPIYRAGYRAARGDYTTELDENDLLELTEDWPAVGGPWPDIFEDSSRKPH